MITIRAYNADLYNTAFVQFRLAKAVEITRIIFIQLSIISNYFAY